MMQHHKPNRITSSPSSPWWAKLGVSLSSLVITLLLLEFGVRVLIPQNPDFFNGMKIKRPSPRPGVSLEYRPNARNNSYVGVPVKINSLGLRDHEIQIPKPPHTFRILGLGDSVTFGFGVRLEETYLKVLERKLNQHADNGIRYEVVNAGVEATDLNYYYDFLLSSSPVLEPDLILIGVTLNDIHEYGNIESRPRRANIVGNLRWIHRLNGLLLIRSHAYAPLYVNLKSLLYWTGVLDINRTIGHALLPLKPPTPKQANAWESSLELLSRIVALARERGYPLLLVVFPMEVQLSQADLEFYRTEFGMSVGPEALRAMPQQRIRDFGMELGVPVVDLLPAFQAVNYHELFLRTQFITYDPIHPSSPGHRLAGEEVYRVLTAKDFLPSPGSSASRIQD